MAEAIGVHRDFLAALEEDALDALPGPAFGKLYIRGYAEVLGFDPQPVLDAYERALHARPPGATPSAALARLRTERMGEPELEEPEPEVKEPDEESVEPEPEDTFEARWARERWEPAERVATPEPEPEPRPEPIPARAVAAAESAASLAPVESHAPAERLQEHPGFHRWPAVAGALLLVLLVVAGVNAFRSKNRPAEPASIPAAPVEAPKERLASPPPVLSAPPQAPAPTPQPASSSRLTVSDFGVGERNRFGPGERVSFTTRVVGGRPGDRIQHVWMRDGTVEQSISLPLQASSWRTHSTKTLGHPGAWAVEARDEQGNVLARAEFTCAP